MALKGDSKRLQEHLENLHIFASYFHIVDSMCVSHDTLPLGKGIIGWGMVKSYVKDKDFIFEIDLKSSNQGN